MGRPLSILYVDDEPDIREVVEIALALDADMSVRTAGSGEEALRLLADPPRPDIVMLDVMMPKMDGPTTLARMRADDRLADLPVIFITARARAQEVAQFRAVGADGVVVKPFDPMTLALEVRAIATRVLS